MVRLLTYRATVEGTLVASSGPTRQAAALEELGAFALVLECVPAHLAEEVTASLNIPTIGIGACAGCDGQIPVLQDALGMNADFRPKLARPFIEGRRCVIDALARLTRR
jgi:3-methyl-2-oxobutanoate hydroxymethyltransferase